MATAQLALEQKLLLSGVTWKTYSTMLREFHDRHMRFTYDRGELEIMILSLQHERYGRFLGRMVLVLSEELDFPVMDGGSVTVRRRKKQRGLEADDCFWIKNEALVRGKKALDLRKDPPPDLAIEVDITQSSLNRLGIYRALKVPEVWRFDGKLLEFLILQATRKYAVEPESRAIPGLAAADLIPFLLQFDNQEATSVIRQFRAWVRQHFGLKQP